MAEEQKSKFSPLSAVVANNIWMDVAQEITPQQSRRVKYGPEETAFYNGVKARWEEHRRKNPHAMPYIPEL
jgi:hypothetical protein